MGGILLKGFVPNMKAKNVYEVLFKFEDFCNHSNVIKKIDVIYKKPDGTSRFSSWEVEIEGKGLLRWTERDELDSQKLKITFEKTEGDIEILSGSWEVIEELDGASIQFEAMYS
ncbi:hypothetical protein NMV76_23735, partial [Escherichia coli]|uniref:hypothetical protein n=1 Tax=Escherichia coli TaxID=562 RepID=UPI00224692ED